MPDRGGAAGRALRDGGLRHAGGLGSGDGPHRGGRALQQTLDEEKAADEKLSSLAEGGINQSAAEATHPARRRRAMGRASAGRKGASTAKTGRRTIRDRDRRVGADVNAVVGGYLRDLAFAQSSQQKMFGYKRAAAAILALDVPLTDLVGPDGALPRISGIGPGSTRVIREILETGESPTVEQAIERSDRRADIERRRQLRRHFLSRAEVRRVLSDPSFAGPTLEQYRGDLQMHSEWSDGYPTVQEIADACLQRGYQYAAVTDHSYGLKIAGGMSMAEAAGSGEPSTRSTPGSAISSGCCRASKRTSTPLASWTSTDDEAATFDVVLAAPHSRLRRNEDQTDRMLAAIAHPAVRILAHPRGRITGSRAGVIADWDAVFASAAQRGVAIEIDGDPARQDLDHTLASRALDAGCLFALDSDAHTTAQLSYAETALAHARLAGIPADRIVNCWPLDRLLAWLSNPSSERSTARRLISAVFETSLIAELCHGRNVMFIRLRESRVIRYADRRASTISCVADRRADCGRG